MEEEEEGGGGSRGGGKEEEEGRPPNDLVSAGVVANQHFQYRAPLDGSMRSCYRLHCCCSHLPQAGLTLHTAWISVL